MGIRSYNIIQPATSAELRLDVADRIGRSATGNSITVGVAETGVEIPAAEPLSSLSFTVAATRSRDGGLTVIGDASHLEGTVNITISADDEAPATMTVVTPD
jgi:hypothetical protein